MPHNNDMIILVTGATGKQGGAVARHLLRAGFQVRALTRNPHQPRARQLHALGAEVVAGDLNDAASLAAALADVYGVFSVQNYWEKGVGFDGEVRQGCQLAEAAQHAGVAHFVQSTMAAAASFDGVPHFASKAAVERCVAAAGLPYTLLGTVYFLDNLLAPKQGGALTFPTLAGSLRPTTRFHLLAVDDIGAAVTQVFQHPARWIGQRLDLAGDALTVPEMKAAYTRVTGRSPKQYRLPAWLLRLLNREFAAQLRWHNRVGWTFSPEAARAALPAPTTFEQFVRHHHIRNL